MYEVVGQLDEADRALALATRRSSSGLDQSRLWRKRAEVAERSGGIRQAQRRLAQRGKGAADGPVDPGRRASTPGGNRPRACIAHCASRGLQEAWNYATSALSKAQLVEDWKTAAHAALMVDNLVTNLRWDGVVVQRPDVVELCRRAGDPVGEAKYLCNRAVDHYFDGEWAEAVRLYRESAERSAEYGHAVSEATCLNNIAEILSDQGRYDDAHGDVPPRPAGPGARSATASASPTPTRTSDDWRRAPGATPKHASSWAPRPVRFATLGSTSDVTEVALRTIEDLLVAGDAVPTRVAADSRTGGASRTLQAYADRLRALAGGLAVRSRGRRSIGASRRPGRPGSRSSWRSRCASGRRSSATAPPATRRTRSCGISRWSRRHHCLRMRDRGC